MEATELRIGNLVTVDNPKYHPRIKGEILKIVGINETENLERNGRSHCVSLNFLEDRKNMVIPAVSQLIEFVSPIKLTAEWFVKFGWSKEKYDAEYQDNVSFKNEILFYSMNSNILTIQSLFDSIEIEHIQHIHQLQNLYFELKGEELQLFPKRK